MRVVRAGDGLFNRLKTPFRIHLIRSAINSLGEIWVRGNIHGKSLDIDSRVIDGECASEEANFIPIRRAFLFHAKNPTSMV